MENIICVCGAVVGISEPFCKTCGLGLPELKAIELKSPKETVPKIRYKLLIQQGDKLFIKSNKLSELF